MHKRCYRKSFKERVKRFQLISFVCFLFFRICGCGSGESGCAVCGCCKACARELDGQEARQRGILDAVKEMIPLDLLLGNLLYCTRHLALNSVIG